MDLEELLGEDLAKQVKEKLGDKQLIANDGTYIPKKKFDDLNNDKKALKTQLEDAHTKIKELEGANPEELKNKIKELEDKYDADTKTLNDKISKREKEYLINDLTRDIKFSSNSAKKSFMEDLIAKDLKIEDGKMLGFEDYVNSYKELDPNAFVSEQSNEGTNIDLGGQHNNNINVDPSKMTYDQYKEWRKNN